MSDAGHGSMRSLCLTVALSLLLSPASAQTPQPGAPTELRVMTFNIWRGGEQVDLARVVEAIRIARADVVGIQEAEGNLRTIADGLGWRHADERLQVISKYPLIDPPDGNGIYTFVELRPGRVVAVANVHLPSDPYGPDAVRDGATADSVRALERAVRLPQIAPWIAVLPELAKRGIPVILTGDLNSPSPTDWTAAMAKARAQVRFALDWPATSAVLQAGLRDSYREVHRDPVRRPGLTWTPGYPAPRLRRGETFDRIDYVFSAGPTTTVASRIVGEPGGPDVDLPVPRWPADHRAVVSTFRVMPAVPPVLVAVHRRSVTVGDQIAVRFHAPGNKGERVAVLPAGGDPGKDAAMTLSTGESPFDGTAVFGTQLLAPGDYEAALLAANGEALARTPFAVLAHGAVPELTAEQPAYAPGEAVVVRWRNAPGNRWDWVGLYRAGDADLERYLAFRHTNARIAGTIAFDRSVLAEPLPPGRYRACLFRDDGYVLLAATTFEIKQ